MTCSSTGRSATSSNGLGTCVVCGYARVPLPPHRMRVYIGAGWYLVDKQPQERRYSRFQISGVRVAPQHGGADVKGVQRMLRRIDEFQRRHKPLAFLFGVFKKFGEDDAGSKAALIAYYGFFSLFPLLLVFTTTLGFVLTGHPALQAKLLNSALRQFPIIGDQISKNVGSLKGNGVALAVGLIGTLWAGMGVTQAGENAMNAVWNVPARKRPNAIFSKLRGLLFLVVFGVGVLATTILAGFAASGAG